MIEYLEWLTAGPTASPQVNAARHARRHGIAWLRLRDGLVLRFTCEGGRVHSRLYGGAA